MLKILLVEDEIIIAANMTKILEKMGHEVVGSTMDYEQQAIGTLETQRAENRQPDLVLLEIKLNGKFDGIDLAAEINKRFDIPIIFTTTYSDVATIERAKKVNPINYLIKPFSPEQLYIAIEIAMFNLVKKEAKSKQDLDEISEGLFIKDALFIKEKFRYTKMPISEVLWIKTEGNYLEIQLIDRKQLRRCLNFSF